MSLFPKAGLVFLAVLLSPFAAIARPLDIVILLDESGSMRRTDPSNARIQAAQLFLQLCHDEQRVGLAGFSTSVRVLNSVDPMETDNRNGIIEKTKAIESSGKYTDIEKALQQGFDSLTRLPDPATNRAVLLMTDGKIDQGDPATDSESQRRIRGPLVADFLQEGIAIYAIGYSPGADRELLEYLSDRTHGLFVRGDDPDELQNLFVRIFEDMALPQTTPIDDSEVVIDGSVTEATFLIMHGKDAKEIALVSPNDQRIARKSVVPGQGTEWFSAPRYELVTIQSPSPGTWKIDPPVSSNEDRVMILTDIQLELDRFDPIARPDSDCSVVAQIAANGKPLTDAAFLESLNVRARLGVEQRTFLDLRDDGKHSDGKHGDGRFGGRYRTPSKPGSYDLEITARTPTFQRRILRTITVMDQWFTVEIENEVVHLKEAIIVKALVGENSTFSPDRMHFKADIQTPEGERRQVDVLPLDERIYTASFPDTETPGDYRITVTGTLDGATGQSPIDDTVGPLNVRVTEESAPAMALPAESHEKTAETSQHGTEEEKEPAVKPTLGETPAPESATVTVPESPRKYPWFWIAIAGGVLLFGASALIVSIALLRRQSTAVSDRPVAMDDLRRRAENIRREEYDEEAHPKRASQKTPAEGASEPEAATGREKEAEEAMTSSKPLVETGQIDTLVDTTKSAMTTTIRETVDEDSEIIEAKLSQSEQKLLDEIMANGGDASGEPSEVQVAAPTPNPAVDVPLEEAEEDLLKEIMTDIQKAEEVEKQDPTTHSENVPIIPEANDGKSQQDAIDDILKQIEGLA
jgi:uncharacterized protein (TIGR03503 family)